MYIFFIVLIFITSALLVLTVLAQNPKSGMAANFGASNAVIGVRGTADFLERFTWILSVCIVVFSLAATVAMPTNSGNSELSNQVDQKIIEQTAPANTTTIPSVVDVEEMAAELGE